MSVWIGQDGERLGPYSEEDVRRWAAEGKFKPDALAWRSGMAEWVPLSVMFPGITDQPPPPPPFAPPSAAHAAFGAPLSGRQASLKSRAEIPEPPSLHWGLLLLLTFLTFGLLGLVWPFIQSTWVRKVDRNSRATLLLAFAMGCFVVGEILALGSGGSPGAAALGGLLVLAYWVLYLMAYFSMADSLRREMRTYDVNVYIGGVTLFFFTVWYLQGQLRWLSKWKATGQTQPAAPKGVFWLLWLIPFVLAILAAIAIPSYQNYLVRSQVAEGVVLADGAKVAVAEYFSNNGKFPSDNAAAGLNDSSAVSGKYVSGVQISQGRVIVAFDNPASSPAIRSGLLVLTPSVNGGDIAWSCTDSTLPNADLPAACRN
jgi:Tfp pilus assembly major pilin PilA